MKRIIGLILCVVLFSAMLLLSCAAPEPVASVPSAWAKTSIEQAEQLGVVPAGYVPDWQAPITREGFCDLAFNTMKASGKTLPVPVETPFTDTENMSIAALNEAGIILGKDEGIFAPADLLTREEAATILWRMSEQLGCVAEDTNLVLYKDHDDIASWAQSPVYVMFTLGVMEGTDTGFLPKASYTTEQAVATLVRLYNVRPAKEAAASTSFAD
ncbi:MAG: hypothetical protein E7414_03875 [Ruminococcaceae bacterium]|nr:hypothetical protein [Oscillospiraceae bacterium]